MNFRIQDPSDQSTEYLIEAILSAADGAVLGGGSFAFASAHGVSLLFDNSQFRTFLSSADMQLVIGTDAVTTPKALARLKKLCGEFAHLKAAAFLNTKPGTLYHPKFCWFARKKGGTIIVGSGNLTRGGLRGNWEAFSVTQVDQGGIASLKTYWGDWLARAKPYLHSIDDPAIIARAKENEVVATKIKDVCDAAGIDTPDVAQEALEDLGPQPDSASNVLIAEIPKGGTRWNQANFNRETFEGFFGAKPGTSHSISLYHVDANGKLPDAPEHRPAVTVKSHNFRFELEAAAGLPYPAAGRPTGIFVRVAARTFWYQLLMPGSHEHAVIAHYLNTNYPMTERMRRVSMDFAQLEAMLPDAPLVKLATSV